MARKNKKNHVQRILLYALTFVLLCVCVLGLTLWDNLTVSVKDVDYSSEKLPLEFYGYRLMLISDFHNSFFFDQIIDIAEEEKPDVILFLGDMTELGTSDMDHTIRLLDGLPKDIPVYGVLGDHEVHSEYVYAIQRQLEQHGLHILNNEKVVLYKDNATIDLIGLRDLHETDEKLLNTALWELQQTRLFLQNNVDPSRFTLVMFHRASVYPAINDIPGTLMLSGHLHGGLLRLPRIGGLIHPYGGILPRYEEGFYPEGLMHLYSDTGCDFNLKRPRFLNSPSVTILAIQN